MIAETCGISPSPTKPDVASHFPSQTSLSKSDQFINKDGLKIVFHSWEVSHPEAVIVGVHGITSHGCFDYLAHRRSESAAHGEKAQQSSDFELCYEKSWVEKFNHMNISFYAIDLQSHGESEGKNGWRCNIADFDDLVVDVLQLLHIINCRVNKSNDSDDFVPLFLMGISLGGCVTLRTAQLLGKVVKDGTLSTVGSNIEGGDPLFLATCIKGFVMLAPMLSLDTMLANPFNRVMSWVGPYFSRIVPNLPAVSLKKNEMFPEAEQDYQDDKMTHKGLLRVSIGVQCVEGLKRTLSSISEMGNLYCKSSKRLSSPGFLFIHSKNDTMCHCSGSTKVHDLLENEDKKVELLDDMWHMLTVEPGCDHVWSLVSSWVRDRKQVKKGEMKTEMSTTPQTSPGED